MRIARFAVVAALLVAGCGGSSSKKSTAPPAAVPNTVTIKGFAFSPNPITVKSGVTITVRNQDDTDHTMTSDDKTSFDTKHVAGGASATFVAPAPGTYTFHCNIHQFMKAKLIVT
jgi:plastocyanin